MLQVWTMKLTESINCYISVRVACTTKVNIEETIIENDGSRKCLCDEWTAVRE